jgi:hypothetical protein
MPSTADLLLLQGVVTFGDPFQGAPIKGYKGPIMVSPRLLRTNLTSFFHLTTTARQAVENGVRWKFAVTAIPY